MDDDPSTVDRATVIAIQPRGSRPPLFYLHVHWEGGAFYCFKLANMLGPDQPFYVLDLYRFDDLPVPPSIEAMASDYVRAIRRRYPQGPYQLAAFCGASPLAYEIAQQLRRAGQGVGLLAFIDPMAGAIGAMRISRRAIEIIGRALRLPAAAQLDAFLRLRYLSRVIRRARDEYSEQARRLIKRWNAQHPRRLRLLPDGGALRQDWLAVFIWAIAGYHPARYSGKQTYFFARDNPDARNLWWGAIRESTPQVEIREIPGDHVTCRTDHLPDLGEHLRACLWAAEATAMPRPTNRATVAQDEPDSQPFAGQSSTRSRGGRPSLTRAPR